MRHIARARIVGVAYSVVPAETAALDILHRSGWQSVTRDAVTAWYTDPGAARRGVSVLAVSGREKIQP